VNKVLKKNPGLKQFITEAVGDAYDVGWLEAAKQTHLDEDIFPEQCPYG
jgi:hypothetical protein